MKTIEEKAKAYDEALERAKQIRNGNPSSGTAIVVCEQIFPELRESEDERIRKELCSYLLKQLGRQKDNLMDAKFDEWFAWLEKQKEQKPVECLRAEKDKWYICIKDFYAGGKKCASAGDLVQAKGGMYMMGREDISEWFRKAYYDEIKPAEWSEEDIEAFVKSYSDSLPMCGEFQSFHDALVHAYRQGVVNTLNSLRSSWKPSEEQMEALLVAIHCTPSDENMLISLYNDLKKLM